MVETRAEEFDLDLRLPGEETRTGLVKEWIEVPIDEKEPTKTLRVGSELGA